MWTRKNVYFTCNRADFVAFASVDTKSLVQNALAQEVVLDVIKTLIKEFFLNFIFELFCVSFNNLFFSSADCISAVIFTILEACFFQKWSSFCNECVFVFKFYSKWSKREFFLAAFCNKFFLKFTHCCDKALCLIKSAEHNFFADFVCTAFNHSKAVFCTGNYDFQLSFFLLLECRVNNIFTVDVSNAGSSNRSVERNVRNAYCS